MKAEDNRFSKLRRNSTWSLIYTIVMLISGFILPRLIMQFYGSDINGLVNSINQFLQVFTFLELGVAAVTKTSLYAAIAENNQAETNRIVTSACKFYRSIGVVLIVYTIVLAIIYPIIIDNVYDVQYVVILILAHAVGMFVQYYFGIVDTCLLDAHQAIHVYYKVQTVSIILNIVMTYGLIYRGFSIYVVKIATATIYILRPIVVRVYLQQRYKVNRYEPYSEDPIKEKWNGVAQHISFIVLQSTDTVLLTLFSSLKNVSVYAVYHLVVSGINSLITALFVGMTAVMGNLYAKEEIGVLKSFFEKVNWLLHCLVSLTYGCASVLIIPFVSVYTAGVTDVDYRQPTFAFFIVLANAWFCLRLPYVILVQAIGGYRDTQKTFIVTAMINVLVSFVLIYKMGLSGVAFGTLLAMVYLTLGLAWYVNRTILEEAFWKQVKLFILDFIQIVLVYLVCSKTTLKKLSYYEWIKQGISVFATSLLIVCIVQMVFNRRILIQFPKYVWKYFQQKRGEM